MAVNTHAALTFWTAALSAACTALNSGNILIYAGVQPTTPETATTAGNTLLATLPLAATAFTSFASGVATAGVITSGTGATGTAAWFRAASAGSTAIIDGTVGTTAGFDMTLNTVSITSGSTVSCTSWTISYPTGE
jgi:hypothetical protein